MKVRDLIKTDIDIDVYDDYDERLGIAYCYGYKPTEEGERHFKEALDMEVEIKDGLGGAVAIVHCENGKEATRAMDLFNALAGWCSIDDFYKWFVDVDNA